MKKVHLKKKALVVILCLVLVLVLLGVALFLIRIFRKEEPSAPVDTVQEESYMHLFYKGKWYTYNTRICTVMFTGVDSDQQLITYNRYSIAPRADSIQLVVFDDYNKKISIFAISRDTITSVARYSMNGQFRDYYDAHLGYAYTFGDGGKASCNNLIESLRKMINGVPIHEYVVTNNSSVGLFNRMAGGVTVTVPNDDLIEMYPEFTKGATVTLTDEEADVFARWRDTSVLFTNVGRMERQKEFSSKILMKLVESVKTDTEGTWNTIQANQKEYLTSIGKNQYLELVERIQNEEFSMDQYYILQGESIHDDDNDLDMFYYDEENLMDTVVKLFYLEDE